jgi:fluoride ion exporter CrcB/FEX
VRLLEQAEWTKASAYIAASVVGGLIAMLIGMRVGNAL